MTAVAPTLEYDPRPTQRRRYRWPFWLTVLAIVGLFFMILVPTMCRSRPAANRIKSASNLRQIGLALKFYANDHADVLPPDFAVLALDTDLVSDVFLSPAGDSYERASGKTAAEWAPKLLDAKYCSYRYVAAGYTLDKLGEDDLLAYEPVQNEDKTGINLLYADGHVDWVQASEGSAARGRYDRLVADDAAGVRPLRWKP